MEHTLQTFRYDVFLSFRGVDTRNNFTSHLYEALKRHNYEVFHDTALPRGQRIAPQLWEAIKESKICVVVFSTRYADSKWCLRELSHMMHCIHTNAQQIVLPVYLDIEQSDVHAPFEQLITNDETEFDHVTVEKWREALQKAGELPRLHLQDDANGDEDELVNQVVEKIRQMLHGQRVNVGDPRLVGIESRVQEVISLLNMGSDDVRVVVMRGPAGIGKTTIAKATYERLEIQFEARNSCFLSDVKGVFEEINGKLTLQKRLMSNLVQNDERCIRVDNYHQGTRNIEKMVNNRKLLLVLDNVDNDEQLKILSVNRAILGRGSRIIVTTRDESSNFVDWIKPDDAMYEPRLLDEKESLEVFCMNVFRQAYPKEGYEEASREAARWGAGFPGVVKDLAEYMRHYQSVEEWGCGLRYVIQNPSCLTDGSL